jgi:MFS transporter, PAT family, beta-lactamase induction signal transducer AmpG
MRYGKIGLLLALYFAEGLPAGLQSALPILLRERKASLVVIGLVSLLALPWSLKALWAPLVDRYGWARIGRRKSWILPLHLGMAIACVIAGILIRQSESSNAPSSLIPICVAIFVMNLFAATQDIAVDGMAVDLLRPSELGLGNAVQVVGYKVGILIASGTLVWLSQWIRWSGMLFATAGLILCVFVITLFAREPSPEAAVLAKRRSFGEIFKEMMRALLLPGTGWLILYLATYKLGEYMCDSMMKPMLVDKGVQKGDIGLWIGTWGMASSIFGSLLGGVLASGNRLIRALWIVSIARLVGLVLQSSLALVPAPLTAGLVIGVTVAEHIPGGALTVCVFTLMMSRTDKAIGASHFTLLATIEVIGKYVGSLVAGPIAQGYGYVTLFTIGCSLAFAFIFLIIPLGREQTRRVTAAAH